MSDEGNGVVRGLDRDLKQKAAAKYDPEREIMCREYIETITGEKLASANFQESLKDGVLLCKMMNKITPDKPIKISTSKMPFKQMENINSFLDRVVALGVPKFDTFQTIDLFENKNMNQVVQCIFSLSRYAVAAGFDGPLLGPKLAKKVERTFTDEQLLASKSAVPLMTAFTSSAGTTGAVGTGRQVYNPAIGVGDTAATTLMLSSKAEAEGSKNATGRIGGVRQIGGEYLDIGNAESEVEVTSIAPSAKVAAEAAES